MSARPSGLERAEMITSTFEWTQRRMWSFMWPMGHCAVSSLLLNPLLTAGVPELETAVVIGVCHQNAKVHAWIESKDGDVIDPTYAQFVDAELDMAYVVIPAREVSDHQGEIKLTPMEEDFYRRSISPTLISDKGWYARARIKDLFDSRLRHVPQGVMF